MSLLAGMLKESQWLWMKLLLFWFLISISEAYAPDNLLITSSGSPIGVPKLGSPIHLSPSHPPLTSHFSKPLMKRRDLAPSFVGFKNIAPMQSDNGVLPSGLAQPPLSPSVSNCCKLDMVMLRGSKECHCVYPIKIDLLLLNVSQNPNWTLFLDNLALELGLQVSQIELINFYVLGLSRLNISMDITPRTGISFSFTEASAINSSLAMHRVHLNPKLVGDYKLLNITWFQAPPPSQAPHIATAPVKPPPHHSAASVSPNTSNKGRHPNLILILGIGAGVLIIAIISLFIVCLCMFSQDKTKAPPMEAEKQRTINPVPVVGSLPHPSSTRFLAYEELKEATNNFESASILGEGGFGKVFKGVLSDGTAVAIKRLTNGGQQGDKEFLVEVEMLSRLHHRNLVKLVGYYSNRDSSQNLLCYELVPNGSLEAWLHGPMGVNCPLDWDTRMKIALDAARGLAYLHEDSQPCVIHRDFKASNILLENNFHAKVADFGLAKQAPEGRTNYLSTRVMGTFGYVAPEYAMTGHLLVKSDVYSYGVVLLELLTGRKPVDMSQPAGQENLVSWARPILRDKDRLDELADPKLGGKYPKEDFIRVCTIAAACVAPEANQRPTMGEVVQSLKMVQRVTEYQDSMASSNVRPNFRQSSTTFESDGTSSIFSSGPFSGLSAFDNDNISRTAVFSEDLHEGR
ncbi:proline-rich receptor-like protein kinase PERK3 isoform X2 [Humulus lupulus]|uniref:proline-rich receptor-like protein kinase PERK3 isoform X2 n=1 Tax=Humulus lupulus TaxID=3486 RepID=UPI002B40A96B|nr:proline-rich receptor-like protein kinase PERK3 isoform X2 [Humulus lupulus]